VRVGGDARRPPHSNDQLSAVGDLPAPLGSRGGYVTGEVSAADAAAIDSTLAALARSLGADDPRTEQQRRANLLADLLLDRLAFDQPDHDNDNDQTAEESDWLEVENIDPDTGELLDTQLQPLDADSEPIGEPIDPATHHPRNRAPKVVKRPQKHRIGVVVPPASLLSATDAPGELADRSRFIPGDELKQLIADALNPDNRDQMLFTRLLTDDGGRLLNTTELGRHPSARLAQAIKIRAGTCRFPTCTGPADRCDLDHHQHGPTARPRRPTWTRSAEVTTEPKPSPGSPASKTTTASTGPCPTPNTTDPSTTPYRPDEPPNIDSVAASLLLPDLSRYIVDVSIRELPKAR
jgi:Domain of unknown function (DUF222)